ncbi:MAG: FAD-dependent oxidoreductase [Deltaproteobacteria bacterium]|nr:FAD-dependent oxidoreductase [Deltaproteobacteria bacterium]
MKQIIEPQRKIDVIQEADVVVIGGGPAGIAAAVSAARNGAQTILLEMFGSLGGMQTQCLNASFSFIDPAIQGGIIDDITYGLKRNGGLIRDISKESRTGKGMGGIFFDVEAYKLLLDEMILAAGIKPLYHVFAAGAVMEKNHIKAVIIESKEGRQAILGKVFIDTTGSGDIIWKSGSPSISDGFSKGPKKGRHAGLGYTFFFGGVDYAKLKAFRREHPEEWGGLWGGKELIKKSKADGTLYGNRAAFLLSEVWGRGSIWILGPQYALPKGHHPWMTEDITQGSIDLRKQAWSMYNLLKKNVGGFEKSYIEKTPTMVLLRDAHRLLGEYTLTEADIRAAKVFDDSIAVSNMCPDVFGPDDEHEWIGSISLYDIPYRCLISKKTDNLMSAGATISTDFITWCATRYCTPSICTGQAAGTAAALAARKKVSPGKLDIKLLQETLSRQGARVGLKDVPKAVINEYQQKAERSAERSKASTF